MQHVEDGKGRVPVVPFGSCSRYVAVILAAGQIAISANSGRIVFTTGLNSSSSAFLAMIQGRRGFHQLKLGFLILALSIRPIVFLSSSSSLPSSSSLSLPSSSSPLSSSSEMSLFRLHQRDQHRKIATERNHVIYNPRAARQTSLIGPWLFPPTANGVGVRLPFRSRRVCSCVCVWSL